jgi:hypothetical protein
MTAAAGFLTHLLGDFEQKIPPPYGTKIAYKSMTKEFGVPLWHWFSCAVAYTRMVGVYSYICV